MIASKGYTLLEVATAATLLGLVFVGALTMVGAGRSTVSENRLRAQAQIVARNMMEDSAFGYPKYATFPPGAQTYTRTAGLRTETDSVISAAVSIDVGAEQSVRFQDPDNGFAPGTAVNYRRVTAKVAWTFNGEDDSVSLTKRIAEVK